MKKFICLFTVMLMSLVSMTSNAQTIESSCFFDNWSIALKGGGTTPICHHAFWGDIRPVVGIEFMKGVTPVLSLGAEGAWTVNTSRINWFNTSNHLAFDRQYVGGLGKINLMNAFGGYLGTPRVFEMAVVGGIGWQHDYFKFKNDFNSIYTKFGLDFNFNLGKSKAWTIAFKPDVVFDLDGCKMDSRRANLELQAGVIYHFKNHNGTHSFVLCDKKYTQSEWDELNNEVNALRHDLNKCVNRPPKVIEKTVVVEKIVNVPTTSNDVSVAPIEVLFSKNSTAVTNKFKGMLTEFAKTIKDTDKKVIVKGFASMEGNNKYNQTLSTKRAKVVKNILIEGGVKPENINATGFGATSEFGKTLNANRIVIVTE